MLAGLQPAAPCQAIGEGALWPCWLLSLLMPMETPVSLLTLAYSPCRSH
jgi:hypothetical protein